MLALIREVAQKILTVCIARVAIYRQLMLF